MSSPYGRATAVIGLTPAGRPAMSEQRLQALLDKADIEYVISCATAVGDSGRLAREAVEQGCGYLICVGDDRVLHEVVNGVMGEAGPINPDLVLAALPVKDNSSDFLRTMGMADGPEDCVRHLDGEPWFGIDVGRVTCRQDGQVSMSYFINMAQAGMGAEMAGRRARLPRKLGRVGDLLSFWLSLKSYRVPKGVIKIDRRSYGGPIANLVVANGQFYRSGVRMAVRAHPGDGKFDVLIQKGTKRDFVETMNKSLKGEHLPSPQIKEYLSSRVEISADVPLPVEADGLLIGCTPATFEIVQQAFRLKI